MMPREFRQLMRKQINDHMGKVFELISPRPYVDEGIFHVLCLYETNRILKINV